MRSFKTKSGSEYFLDDERKELSGEKIMFPIKYVGNPFVMTGYPAKITLESGDVIRTSMVTEIN